MSAYIITRVYEDMYYCELRSLGYLGRLIAQSSPNRRFMLGVIEMRRYADKHGITVKWTSTTPLEDGRSAA
jgi:hypothetical protein